MRENYSIKAFIGRFLLQKICLIMLFCPIMLFGQKKSIASQTLSTVILQNDVKMKISYRLIDCEKGTDIPNKYAVFTFENKTTSDLKIELKYEIYFKGDRVERDPAMLRATINLGSLQKTTGNCSIGTDGMSLFLSDTGEKGFQIKIIDVNAS